MNEHPIFLVGAHKSGTSLLRSILDGHPELFTVPFESHYFQNMHYWVDCNYRMERPKKLTKEQLIERFVARLKHLNQADDTIGDLPRKLRSTSTLSPMSSVRYRLNLMIARALNYT